MKKSRYSDSQILSILKQNEAGALVPDLCREHGRSTSTRTHLIYDGYGVAVDYKKSYYCFNKAAEKGVPKDYISAYSGWNIAAANGEKTSQNNRKILEKLMTRTEISEAQKLSKELYKKYNKRRFSDALKITNTVRRGLYH